MKVLIVPGYGDVDSYIKRLTKRWPKRYGLDIYIHPFGSTDPPEKYNDNWRRFVEVLKRERPEAIIGISFGFSIAARAMIEYPDQVKRVVSICGPHDLQDMNPKTIRTKYPMLGKSLAALNPKDLQPDRILTLRSWYDEVLRDAKVAVPGAKNRHIPMVEHAASIVVSLAVQGRLIAKFLKANR